MGPDRPHRGETDHGTTGRRVSGARQPSCDAARAALDNTIRNDWALIVARVAGLTAGDLQLAEDAVQEAALVALEHWQLESVPAAPTAWLITTARRKVIDALRRKHTLARKLT